MRLLGSGLKGMRMFPTINQLRVAVRNWQSHVEAVLKQAHESSVSSSISAHQLT